MEHRGHSIQVAAKFNSAGRCCDASYVIHRSGEVDAMFAGVLGDGFASIADAEAAALLRAKRWIDEQLDRFAGKDRHQ